ncbi:hypothetical protein B2K11_11725 [Microbacterium sp. B35-30]|nr:hypothetical protein B2K11_11725 [Microbacterium sp. B35-30]
MRPTVFHDDESVVMIYPEQPSRVLGQSSSEGAANREGLTIHFLKPMVGQQPEQLFVGQVPSQIADKGCSCLQGSICDIEDARPIGLLSFHPSDKAAGSDEMKHS